MISITCINNYLSSFVEIFFHIKQLQNSHNGNLCVNEFKTFLHVHEIISSLTNPFIIYSIIMLDHSKSDIASPPFIWYHYIIFFIIYHPINPLSKACSFYFLIWHPRKVWTRLVIYTQTHTHIYPSNAFDIFHKTSMGFGVFWYEANLHQCCLVIKFKYICGNCWFRIYFKFSKSKPTNSKVVSNSLDYQIFNLKQPISLKFKVTFEF